MIIRNAKFWDAASPRLIAREINATTLGGWPPYSRHPGENGKRIFQARVRAGSIEVRCADGWTAVERRHVYLGQGSYWTTE